jgi:hypothetical protein
MGVGLLILVAACGLGAATLLMWACARLAQVENATVRGSVIPACGFGLPLAGAAQVLRTGVGTPAGLLLVAAAIGLGLWIIRTAYRTTWGQAGLTWFLHLCAWVIVGALMWRARG